MIARSSWVLHREIRKDARNARTCTLQCPYLLGAQWIEDSQHRSHDHRVLRLEIVCHADGEHLHCDDLAIVPAARRAVHAWVARDEELGELVHKFACRSAAAPHEAWTVRERVDKLRPTRRREARRAQVVVRGKVAVELRSCEVPPTSVWVCVSLGGEPSDAPRSSCPTPLGECPSSHCCVIVIAPKKKWCWSSQCLLVTAGFVRAIRARGDLIKCFGNGCHCWVGKVHGSPIYRAAAAQPRYFCVSFNHISKEDRLLASKTPIFIWIVIAIAICF